MKSVMVEDMAAMQFITRYRSHEDRSKPRRVLDTVKVGETYISRLAMDPDAVAGNMYHKDTNIILFVTRGEVRMKFVRIDSGEYEEIEATPSFGIIHQPPLSALAIKNISLTESVVFCFSNKPLRTNDDHAFSIYDQETGVPLSIRVPKLKGLRQVKNRVKPMVHYPFQQDRRKPGRVLESVKVGEVWVSRLTVEPGIVTGNLYHKSTHVLLFVAQGRLRFKFVQINTGEKKEFEMEPGRGLVHVPPFVAMADKNIGKEPAVVIYFSNYQFRQDDDFEYKIY